MHCTMRGLWLIVYFVIASGLGEDLAQPYRARAKALIEEHSVMVFSKTYCPHCTKAKALLDSLMVSYTALELDKDHDGPYVQMALVGLSHGQKTVPNIFIKGKHIGGNAELQTLHRSGQLLPLLESQGILHRRDEF